MMTHPLKKLQGRLEAAFPSARTSLDLPANEQAPAWLDLWFGQSHATVEAALEGPFRISVRSDILFGEGPDETHNSLEDAYSRVKQLLASNEQTSPLSLAELRKHRRVSQACLADTLQLQQGTISRFERRDDVMLSTMAAYVKALGGRLEIRAVFGEKSHPLQVGPSEEDPV